jgi:hypothetical protein
MIQASERKTGEGVSVKIRDKLTMFALVRWWIRLTGGRRTRGWLMAALLALLAGCSTPPIAFQNNSHRQVYSLN